MMPMMPAEAMDITFQVRDMAKWISEDVNLSRQFHEWLEANDRIKDSEKGQLNFTHIAAMMESLGELEKTHIRVLAVIIPTLGDVVSGIAELLSEMEDEDDDTGN